MFNLVRKGILCYNNPLILFPKTKLGFLFNKNIFINFISCSTNGTNLLEFTNSSFIEYHSFVFFSSKKNRIFLYILNEYIFDRRFIYSILFLKKNKSRCRRTKRFIFQHFSEYFIGISLQNYIRKYSISSKLGISHLLLLAEYFNIIWFLFWNKDWLSSKEKRLKLPSRGKKKFQKWSFNLLYIKLKKPITYIVKKLKRNKKKPIILKNNFNIGFKYGYIGINYAYLLSKRGVLA